MHHRYAMPTPPPSPRVITGETFRCLPGRECLELLSEPSVQITGCHFSGGSTCLRLNGCAAVTIEGCTFDGMTGPPDPDGQAIQIIRPAGVHTIDRCSFVASPQAEDLVNIFSDQPCTGSVLVTGCSWIGRGLSGSSTSLCCDGPNCPPVHVKGGRMQGARCGITVAAGRGHIIDGVRMVGCQNQIYVFQGYGTPAAATLIGYSAADVLLGQGVKAGDVIVRAA